MKKQFIYLVLAGAISAGLSACGGGGTDSGATVAGTEVGAGGTGNNPTSTVDAAASGAITGFGSVIVNGVKYEDRVATVEIDDKGTDVFSTTANLKIGMQVDLKAAGSAAQKIQVASQFRGPVTAVTNSSLVVLGQTITVETSGVDAVALEGFIDFASIKVGDWVEIHAAETTAGAFKASRIERESSTASSAIRLSGKISGFDSAAKTFNVGSTKVNFANASLSPSAAVLANDTRVRVYSDTAATAGVVNAKTIRVRDAKLEGIRNVNLGGVISDFTSAASFTVNGIKVDASKAQIKNGVAADLANGAAVRVKGPVTAGILIATELELKKNQNAESALLNVKGFVTDFVSAASFKLRGQQIDASKAVFEGGTSANLANGSFIEVKLSLVNGALVASKVEFQTAPIGTFDDSFSVTGSITDFDASTRSFKIAGYTVKINSDSINSQLSIIGFVNGASFTVDIKNNNGVLELVKAQTSQSSSSSSFSLSASGIIASASAGTFTLNGLDITVDAATVYENGTAANLVAGTKVSVQAGRVNGKYVAKKVEFEVQGANGVEVKVDGLITDFVSLANFKAAGVKVDASAAVFRDGVAADVKNGKRVRIEGRMDASGVLKASKVELR
jgi:Domain of unknown function (DUF5666)